MFSAHAHWKLVSLSVLTWAMLFAASSGQPIQPNDLVLGLSKSDPALSLETVRGPTQEFGGEFQKAFWDEPFIQSVELDNLNGLSHNPQGNLLGVIFGADSDVGGSIFSLAAAEEVKTDQKIGDTLGLGGDGVSISRLGGLSVSPSNTRIAVTGYDSGRVIVFDYTAGDGKGTGASLGGARESGDGFLSQFDTQGTTWLDNDRLLAFATDGRVMQINAATMDAASVAQLTTGGGGETNRSEFTDITYNPTVSPFVYASYGAFDRDASATLNSLFVLDPRDSFSLVKTVDLSESMETGREIALDREGNLYVSQFTATIELILNARDPTQLSDNDSIDWYGPVETASFSGIDIAIGLPIEPLPLKGDFDGNGTLDSVDIDLLSAAVIGADSDPQFDLNEDGNVDGEDRVVWVVDLRNTYFGDSNLDGEFGSGDLVAVFGGGKFESGESAGWSEGDWNGDAAFGSGDLVTAFAEGGFEMGPRQATAVVPEPSGVGWLLFSTVMCGAVGRLERKRWRTGFGR